MSFRVGQFDLPGMSDRGNGAIEFECTEEEATAGENALAFLKDVRVHPQFAERLQKGVIAIGLSEYSHMLLDRNDLTVNSQKSKWDPVVQDDLCRAVAAVWKAYVFSSLPIFLFYRAAYLRVLGCEAEAKRWFEVFCTRNAAFVPDQLDELLMEREGSDLGKALRFAETVAGVSIAP